jgi:hypothetical protein
MSRIYERLLIQCKKLSDACSHGIIISGRKIGSSVIVREKGISREARAVFFQQIACAPDSVSGCRYCQYPVYDVSSLECAEIIAIILKQPESSR